MLAKPLYVRWSGGRCVSDGSLQAAPLNTTKTGFVFIKRLQAGGSKQCGGFCACQEQKEALVLLPATREQNAAFCCSLGLVGWWWGGGLRSVPGLGSAGRRRWLGPRPPEEQHSWDGRRRRRPSLLKTTAPALLCNRAWTEIKVGAGGGWGGDRGLRGGGEGGWRLMLAASPQGSQFKENCQESATEAGAHLGSRHQS